MSGAITEKLRFLGALGTQNSVCSNAPRDQHALTPLIWEHVNPYGRFELE